MATSRTYFEEAIESWEAAGQGKPNFHRNLALREARKIQLFPLLEVGAALFVSAGLVALTFSGVAKSFGSVSGISLLFTFWLGRREWGFRKQALGNQGGRSAPIKQFPRLQQEVSVASKEIGVTEPGVVRVHLGSELLLTPHLIEGVLMTKPCDLHPGIKMLLRFDLEEMKILLFVVLAGSRHGVEHVGVQCGYAHSIAEVRLGPGGFPIYNKGGFLGRRLRRGLQRMNPNWMLMHQESIRSAQQLAAQKFGKEEVLRVAAKALLFEELHLRQFPYSGEGQFHPDDLAAFSAEYDSQAALELLQSKFSEDLMSGDTSLNLRRLARNLGLEDKRGDAQWLGSLARSVCAPPKQGALYELFGEKSQSILDSVSLEAQEFIRQLGVHRKRAELALELVQSIPPDKNSKNKQVWAAQEFFQAHDYAACRAVCDQALHHFPGDRDLIRFQVQALVRLRDPDAEDAARASIDGNDLCTLWGLTALKELYELRGDTDSAREFEFEAFGVQRKLEELESDLAILKNCLVKPLEIGPERSEHLLQILAQYKHLHDVFLVEILHPALEEPVKRAYFYVIPSNFHDRIKDVRTLVLDSVIPLLPEIAFDQFYVSGTSTWFDQDAIHSTLRSARIPQFYRPKHRRKILRRAKG